MFHTTCQGKDSSVS